MTQIRYSSLFAHSLPSPGTNRERKQRSTKRAFTLIELLTVIAIIGILSAIIIPTVGGVRQKARDVQCRSNLRQVAMGVITYATEQKTLPGPLYSRVAPALMNNNKKGRLAGFLTPYFNVTLFDNQTVLVPILVCPGFAMEKPDLLNPPDEMAITYINNGSNKIIPDYNGTVWGSPDSSSPNNMPVALTQIPSPTRTWMIADIDAEKASGWGGWDMSKLVSKPSHGSTRNRAYFDGHVKSVPVNEPD